MVKKIPLFSLWLIIFVASLIKGPGIAVAAETVLVLQSVKIPLYEEVLSGFTSVCSNQEIEQLIIGEQETVEVVRRINQLKPSLILAIGLSALKKIAEARNVPIVYCMVLSSPDNPLTKATNITGVSMNIPQGQQLATFVKALPGVRTIGMIYDPERTARLVARAQEAADRMGIVLVTHPVTSAKEVAPALRSMQGKIDAFWMLPDLTVINDVTVEHMLSVSVTNSLPILTFSDKYVEQGALMSITIDTFDLGVQAGELAKAILSGTPVNNLPPQEARKGILFINMKIAKKLNTTIDNTVIKDSKIIR